MLFSVVIPVFNRAAMVRRALTSILEQGESDIEVIVVDDGSTDETTETLRAFGDRIRVIRQPNAGPGAARNQGVRVARGDYLVMFDSDDLQFPWSLETYRKVIETCDRPAFISGSPVVFHHDGELNGLDASEPQTSVHTDYFAFLEGRPPGWGWWGNSSFVIRKDVVDGTAGYPTSNIGSDDADLALQIGDSPGYVRVLSPPTFGYREHDEGISRSAAAFVRDVWHLIHRESAGAYAGGRRRRLARWHLIAMFARPAILQLLRLRRFRDAHRMFIAVLPWNLRLLRIRFFAAYIAYWAAACLRRKPDPAD